MGQAIKSKVVAREMPPWGADPKESLQMRNDRSLSEAQIRRSRPGSMPERRAATPADLPPAPKFAEGWTYGREPDCDHRDAARVRHSGRR